MSTRDPAPTRALAPARGIAVVSVAGFAVFYTVYAAAATLFAGDNPGLVVFVMMCIVVAAQPLTAIFANRARWRRTVVMGAVAAMALGVLGAGLPLHVPMQVLLGGGFGVFVVSSTAWTKEAVPPELLPRALGVYGFGSGLGGALGAPLGIWLAGAWGAVGVAAAGVMFAAVGVAAAASVRVPAGIAGAGSAPAAQDAGVPSGSGAQDAAIPSGAGAQEASTPATRPAASARTASLLAVFPTLVLMAHVFAVINYGATLSSLGARFDAAAAWVPVLAAFVLQLATALGRLAGGGEGWFSPGRALAAGLVAITLGVIGFIWLPGAGLGLAASILIGLAAGVVQTASLALLMHRAHGEVAITQTSAAWNSSFDIGLGAGAYLASTVARA